MDWLDLLLSAAPSVVTIALVLIVLSLVDKYLKRGSAAVAGHQFRNQMIMLSLSATGLLIVIVVVPIGDARRGQLLGLIGILLSAAIALSSTTVLGNAMAGIMLRTMQNFRMGDFVRCGEFFGRVSERGLFHTEIQTEDRELTTIPNLFLVTHPVTTTRASGTMVFCTVSLGYDVPRSRVEKHLLKAAEAANLTDAFVQVPKLGDFSVTYRVAGLLVEVKRLISARSRLRASVLDALHAAGIEIVSPNFMNQRVYDPSASFIPRRVRETSADESTLTPEELVFDKAEEAESLESLRESYKAVVGELKVQEELLKKTEEGAEQERVNREVSILKIRKERLEKVVSAREARAKDKDKE